MLTITAFTLTHSISLVVVMLTTLVVNVAAVEAIIALSIAHLAYDNSRHILYALRGNQRVNSLAYRYPASIAGVFGLLHGLGFSNILSQFGLPESDRLLALFSFNLGIEVGQLAFVFSVLLVISIIARLASKIEITATNLAKLDGVTFEKPSDYKLYPNKPYPNWLYFLSLIVVYLIGSVSMFWTLERTANALF